MTSRRQARRQAIDVLYQADVTGRDPRVVLADVQAAGHMVSSFAEELVEGVAAHQQEIDAALASGAENWSLERMATLDRTILRIACFELFHRPDIPPGAAVNEAVEAAKDLSTEDSGRFVNGVLGTIAQGVRGPSEPRPAGGAG